MITTPDARIAAAFYRFWRQMGNDPQRALARTRVLVARRLLGITGDLPDEFYTGLEQ